MFGGGVADKFGNIYEAYWAVRQLLDVVQGRAVSMRLEGISEAFNGFEFVVDDGQQKAWHQTKITAQGQNWTPRALHREGVVKAFSSRIAAGDHCVFVSQSPAVDLFELASKARYAEDFQDFDGALAATPRQKFQEFLVVAEMDAERAFNLLRHCEFRTLPQEEIKAAIENYAGLLFQNDPETVFSVVRGYLEERLNRDLTTDVVRQELTAKTELRFKDWSLRPTIRARLASENKSYLESYIPFGAAGHLIKRAHAAEIIASLEDKAGAGVVMLSGIAGSGKSGIVRDLVNGLAERDILHLVFRVDYHLNCRSPEALGESVLGICESPATILKGLSPDKLSVLVIDQLDAISEISGRNGTTRNAVMRIVEEARRYSTVRVVLICRSFDIENDERIKLLRQRQDFRQFDVPLLQWNSDVAPVLGELGVQADKLDAAQRELLCLPLNLAVFAELANETDTQFSSRNDLFGKLLLKKERALNDNREPPNWPLALPLRALSDWMSSRQKLDAPVAVLDDYARSADILSSEHLISRSRGTVSFFHESFFDYMFARSFVAKNQTIVDLLTSSEQHLFRRTQVRQILESIRQSDFSRYLDELSGIFNSSYVRVHIKVAVAKWLAALASPAPEERDIVLAFDTPDVAFPVLVRDAILGTGGWFDVLVEHQWLARQLDSEAEPRKRALLWFLEKIAGERSEAIAKLLDNWWDGNDARGCELLNWFSHMRQQTAAPSLVGLCCRVVASRPSNLFAGDDIRQELLIARWASSEAAEDAASILKVYFNTWYDANPGDQPFARDVFKQRDIHSLAELGKKSPIALLEGTVEALTRSFAVINAKEEGGERDYTFYFRQMGTAGFGADRLIQLMRAALQAVAATNPDTARVLLGRIDPRLHEVAIHLHLETISANPKQLADLLLPLVELPEVLEAGWEGAKWRSFADAAGAALPHLDAVSALDVECFLLRYWPEIDYAAQAASEVTQARASAGERSHAMHYLSVSGHRQFCILHTIGEENLGASARKRLAELGRKFKTHEVDEPTSTRMRSVDSPISLGRARYMSDDNWIDAMARYGGDHRSKQQDRYIGGARQLSSVLKATVKVDPCRFRSLLGRLPSDADDSYIRAFIEGLLDSEAIEVNDLEAAVLIAHGWQDRPFGDIICRAFHNHPELCERDELWSALVWYAENGSAPGKAELSESFASTELVTIEYLLEQGGHILIRGINSVRGSALEALTQVLWKVPARTAEARDLVERRVVAESDLSVRCCLVGPLAPMFNIDKIRCAELLEALVGEVSGSQSGLVVLLTRPAVSLMPYIVHQIPDVGRRLIERMAASNEERIRLVAAWHVMRSSYHEGDYVEWADRLENQDINARLLSADIACNAVAEATFRDRAFNKVRKFFNDGDEGVRRKAAEVFRYVPRDQPELADELATPFLASDAFREETFAFLHFLEEAQISVSNFVVAAAERVLQAVATEGAGQHDMSLHQLNDLLNREYVNSERDPALRRRLLDVIDQMLTLDLRGVDDLFKKHER
ncbi:hypothetical protein [Rhizobium sp. HT1-10]|uniref:hypothetical protein n=1 Tax=Rhizobium sp. HT1-10 TaxID=3111638 RepID=UPI003C231F0C